MTQRLIRDEDCLPQYFKDEPAKQKRIVVPEGMLEAAYGDTPWPCDWTVEQCVEHSLKAALRWLSENPIVPTSEQVRKTMAPQQVQWPSYFACFAERWQRRMFLAPETEVPEEIADLIVESNPHCAFTSDGINGMILAAFRRGQNALGRGDRR